MGFNTIPGSRWSYGSIKKIGKSPYDASIGDFVSIGSGVKWVAVGHHVDWVTTYPFTDDLVRKLWVGDESYKPSQVNYGPLIIENDVWIGNDVTFVGYVKIRSGAVIAAGSVVRGLVPHYAIVYGNPAEVTKYRFTENQMRGLLEIRWWEWDDEKIMNNIELMCSDKVDEFIKKHKQ